MLYYLTLDPLYTGQSEESLGYTLRNVGLTKEKV